jgi:hypothetical protein
MTPPRLRLSRFSPRWWQQGALKLSHPDGVILRLEGKAALNVA